MKTKFILSTSLLTLFIFLLSGSALASRDSNNCMDLNIFCKYQGLRSNLEKAGEEFNMLLEPTTNPNFQAMQFVIDRTIGCACVSEKHMDVLKNNPNCNVSKYSKKLLKFYEDNKEKIIKHMQKEDPDLEIVTLFDYFKETAGNDFLQK